MMVVVYNQKNIFVIVWLSFPSVDSNFLSEAVRTENVFFCFGSSNRTSNSVLKKELFKVVHAT